MLLHSLLVALPLAAATPPPADAKALAVAERVMQALGGADGWRQTRFLRFDFAVEADGKIALSRSHYWDKWSGRYRVEGKTKEGKTFLVLMNLDTREGAAWQDGKPAEGELLKELLKRGYEVWVNDSYWLLMPYKLRDPGVRLALEGQARFGDVECDKLALSFDSVGLTPKDRYWVFVNRDSHLVEGWEYVLQDQQGPPTRWEWKGWRPYGNIQLAPERVNAKDKRRILFPVLDAPASLADSVFSSPEPPR
jgi:hypothetical protein